MPNFQEIPQLIGCSEEGSTIRFTCVLDTIALYKKECNLDLNPEFQRGYVWTESQKTKYVEFLLQGGKSGRDILFNYPLWIQRHQNPIDKEDPLLNRMVIVDGKQRLSAVCGFLEDQVPVFGHLRSEFTGHLRGINYLTFCINQLTTRKEVLTWYLQLNSGGTVHTDDELNKVRKMIKEAKC